MSSQGKLSGMRKAMAKGPNPKERPGNKQREPQKKTGKWEE